MDASGGKLKEVRLTTPVTEEQLKVLEISNVVYIDGVIYTARESVYKKVITDGISPPESFATLGNINFENRKLAVAVTAPTLSVPSSSTVAAGEQWKLIFPRVAKLSGGEMPSVMTFL